MNNNKTIIAIYLDLAKAFETVDHNILLSKLNYYGIRGIAFDLFKSYLENRKQCVKSNGAISKILNLNCGVPQRSTLGPLLFLLYINELNVVTSFKTILFADDTCLVASGKNNTWLEKETNLKLKKINTWFLANKLTINYNKTNFMVINGNKSRRYNFKLMMGENILKQVTSVKYLGVIMDEKMSWKNHIETIKTKLSRACNVVYKLRYIVPLKTLICVYYSLVYSHLNYAILSWGSTCKSNLESLYTLQKKFLKIMLFHDQRYSTDLLFSKLKLLKFDDIFKIELAKHVHRQQTNQLPSVFSGQYTKAKDTHTYNTRFATSQQLRTEKYKTTFGQRTTTYQGGKLWNNIPLELKQKNSVFKKGYTKFLMDKYDK